MIHCKLNSCLVHIIKFMIMKPEVEIDPVLAVFQTGHPTDGSEPKDQASPDAQKIR